MHKKSVQNAVLKVSSRTTLARANQDRDCSTFEDFAYHMIEEAQRKRATDIFKLGGNVYAFDSTTIGLCLSVFGGRSSVRIVCHHYLLSGCHCSKRHEARKSTYEVLQILGISLTDKMHLRDLPDNTKSQNVKELFRPNKQIFLTFYLTDYLR